MWETLVIPAVLVAAVVMYDGLVRLRQQVDSAWADVDVPLDRRHDRVPNLAAHEKGTPEGVAHARSARTRTFPSVPIARTFGFTPREFCEVAEADKAVPKVGFGDA